MCKTGWTVLRLLLLGSLRRVAAETRQSAGESSVWSLSERSDIW
jgi:hypothetical protein